MTDSTMETACEATTETTDIETKKVDPVGDVMFLVQNKMRIRVSSKILSVASKVFAAMLGERFVEGQQLSVASPPQIELPEDDADSMWLMCRLLHHQVRVKEEQTSTTLVKLAVLADKYDCLQSLGFLLKSSAEIGLKAGSWEPKELVEILIVSYVLDDSSMFKEVSTSLVLVYDMHRSFLDFFDIHGLKLLPSLTLALLDEQKNQLQFNLFNELRQVITFEKEYNDPKCWAELADMSGAADSPTALSFSELLVEFEKIGETLGYFLSSVRSDLERWHNEQITDVLDLKLKPNFIFHEFIRHIQITLNKFEEKKKGLCLHCVRTEQRHAGTCDLEH